MLFVWTGDFPSLDTKYQVGPCRVDDAMEVVASLCGDIPEATLSVLEKSPLARTIELFQAYVEILWNKPIQFSCYLI